MKKLILACLLLPFMFSNVNAEEKIGQVNKIQTYAYGTKVYQNQASPLFARDEVYQNEVIETVKTGAIWITFNDDTELFMGESGSLTLDKFIYDADNEDSMVVTLAIGLFRFISGSIQSEKVIIKGPVATMGIRGTDIEIMIDDTGAMTATAFEGEITVRILGMIVRSDGCQTIEINADGYLEDIRSCPPGGPSIGPASFPSNNNQGGRNNQSNSDADPSGSSSGSGPSGGPGNGNGNAGNSGNGGGNTNGSGPGTGNNGGNNGQGNGAGNGGGGNGNGGGEK